jgi:hypothetical protein
LGKKKSASKRRRARKANATGNNPVAAKRLEIEALELELCKAHDGTLRGFVEPAIALGAYRIQGQAAMLLGRCLLKPELESRPLPASFALSGRIKYSGTFRAGDAILVLGIALEEDAGTDIASVFALLERPQELSFWKQGDSIPAPHPLWELNANTDESNGSPLELLTGSAPLEATTKADDYIGTSAFWARAQRKQEDIRLHFADAERRNEWTLRVSLKLS